MAWRNGNLANRNWRMGVCSSASMLCVHTLSRKTVTILKDGITATKGFPGT